MIGFGPKAPQDCINLSPTGDLREAAAQLFLTLRKLDKRNIGTFSSNVDIIEGLVEDTLENFLKKHHEEKIIFGLTKFWRVPFNSVEKKYNSEIL